MQRGDKHGSHRNMNREVLIHISLFGPIYCGDSIFFSICCANGLTGANFYSMLEDIHVVVLYSKKRRDIHDHF